MISSWYLLAVLVLGVLGWGYAYGDDNCYHNFQVTTDKQMYKPGDTVIMTFKSAYVNCEPNNAPFLLSIINQTGGASDIIYQKTLLYNPGGVIFNYTLPQASSLPVFDRYSIKTEANSTSGPAVSNWDIFVKENAPDQTYNFQIWPFQSAVTRGSLVFIMAQLCPVPNTDQGLEPIVDNKTGLIVSPGPEVLVNYYFTAPKGTQIIRQEGINGNWAECYNSQARGDLFSNTTGTWSVYAVAKWIENNSTHTLQSKTVNFQIQETITDIANLTKIFDLAKVNQTQIAVGCQFQYNCNFRYDSLDWSPDGKFIVFTIGSTPSAHVWKIDLQTKQSEDLNIPMKTDSILYLRISPDENSILFFADHVIDSNNNQIPDLYRFDIQEKKLTQITNNTAHDLVESALWTPDGNIIYSRIHVKQLIDNSSPTDLWLVDRNGKPINKIYSEPRNFVIYDISKDGKKMLISDRRVLDLDTMKTQDIVTTFADSLQNSRFAPNDDLFVSTPGATYSPGGPIYIASTDGGYEQSLQVNNLTPSLPVPSPDGKFIAFSTDAKNTGEKPEYYGIYLLELTQPVPEFPLAEIVLLASIASVIAFSRIMIRK